MQHGAKSCFCAMRRTGIAASELLSAEKCYPKPKKTIKQKIAHN
jgi:hypothetical protein